MTHTSPSSSVLYAGFWIRVVASTIDSLILTAASWMLVTCVIGGIYWLKKWTGGLSEGEADQSLLSVLDPVMMQFVVVGIYTALCGLYFIYAHFRYGTTIGKKPFSIYVVNAADLRPLTLKQSVVRFLGELISYLPFGIGCLMAAFHPRKQTLHDLIASTVSVRRDK